MTRLRVSSRVVLGAWLLALGCTPTSGQETGSAPASLTAINAMRIRASCATTSGASPLVGNGKLDAAAAELSRQGNVNRPLNDTLRVSGYRATRSMFFQVNGVAGGAALARFLEQRYCAQITSPEWREIGFHQGLAGSQPQVWIILATPFSPPTAQHVAGLPESAVDLVNRARAQARKCGDKHFPAVAPVKWNILLANVARRHAEDMAEHDYFSHDGRDGSKPADRVTRSAYAWRTVGENIAAGQASIEEAVRGWIDSPPHCANLMGPQFTEMGVGFASNPDTKMGTYWGQLFATPRETR